MSKKKILSKALCGVLMGGVLLTSANFALAGTDTTAADNGTKPPVYGAKIIGNRAESAQQNLQEVLAELVENAVITQVQADELSALMEARDNQRRAYWEEIKNMTPEERQALRQERQENRPFVCVNAVDQGIITEEQAAAIGEALQERMHTERQEAVQEKLNGLVAKGTITGEQAEAILTRMDEIASQRLAERDKIRAMSPEERREYMQNQQRPNLIRELVDDGTLTKEQAYDIAQTLRPQKNSPGKGMGRHYGQRMGGQGSCFFNR